MHKALRRLPSLDFLKGFEAAGRLLSFTRAAEELFLTQSALSRQVQALEEALGVALFERRHRALALTPAGQAFHRDVTAALSALAAAADAVHGTSRAPGVTLSTTVSFASLWVIPRLPAFRARASRHRGLHLGRRPARRPGARRSRRGGPLFARRQGAGRCCPPLRRANDTGREPEARRAGRDAAQQCGRSLATRADPSR